MLLVSFIPTRTCIIVRGKMHSRLHPHSPIATLRRRLSLAAWYRHRVPDIYIFVAVIINTSTYHILPHHGQYFRRRPDTVVARRTAAPTLCVIRDNTLTRVLSGEWHKLQYRLLSHGGVTPPSHVHRHSTAATSGGLVQPARARQ